jgi:hypothetical protein
MHIVLAGLVMTSRHRGDGANHAMMKKTEAP